MKSYILSIDQGTTGSTALIIDQDNYEVVSKENCEFPQIFPKPGWVEHDLNQIWGSIEKSITLALKKKNISAKNIIAIGITNQRETTCAFRKDGTPLAKAIVWQDRRTSHFCEENKLGYEKFQKKTGLPLDPYFSGTKMNWLLKNNTDVQKASQDKDLYMSTIDSYLLYKLTGFKSFKTEASNASRTLLMNLTTCEWDSELTEFFQVPKDSLPQIEDSFTNFGSTLGLSFLPDGIPISCILGDQQAALFGQGGYKEGDLKCTYGTGAFILLNTGDKITYSSNKLLTTVAFKHKNKAIYALEGSTYIAGAAVQWLRDNLKVINNAADVETLAIHAQEEQMEELFFLPFFTGIGSPYWNSEAKGSILGLSRGTSINEISRACLEGIALSVNDSITALTSDVDFRVEEILVDGGASLNNFLLQLQSNFSKCIITRPKVIETTAYGVAMGALVGLDKISLSKVKELWTRDISITPNISSYFKNKQKAWTELISKLY